jgi:protein ImuB
MFAALLSVDRDRTAADALVALARDFSPRYEVHGARAVVVDVGGLGRLLGGPRAIADALAHDAASRSLRVHVALARTWTAAFVLAHARPGVTVVNPGEEAAALAPLNIQVFQHLSAAPAAMPAAASAKREAGARPRGALALPEISTFTHWGLRTLGELAALPDADLVARLGRPARVWQAIARGADERPLVPAVDEERFESSIELEWPIEGQEPLSFVLTRLLEPLSTRLERRDRGAAVLHVRLQLVTRALGEPHEIHARRLELPAPMRDVRTLRTLALLDLESHPPAAAIDAVTVVIEPTPARVLQHTLFARAQAQPERMTTLLARLHALVGQDRVGAPAVVDSYRPGAFAMTAFAADVSSLDMPSPALGPLTSDLRPLTSNLRPLTSALRRYRIPVAARVVVEQGRPVKVTTDRRAITGGAVQDASGPWRTSGEWWASGAGGAGGAGKAGWNRDEWDVSLADGARYRLFEERDTGRWFVDAVID